MSGSQEILCRGAAIGPRRGVALLIVLVVMLFLSALGSALLALTVVDLRIGENYEMSARLLYLAEAGLDDARVLLQNARRPASQLLADTAGPDGILVASKDPAALVASDDAPFVDWRPIIAGQEAAGEYAVFLRNDVGDGVSSVLDTNRVLSLLSIARIATTRKILTAVVSRSGFPELQAAITAGSFGGLDSRLQTPQGTERVVAGIVANATTIHNPPWGGLTTLADIGGPADYPVTVVNGDARFGPGYGYGVLLVRGELTVEGSFNWQGLILVIGQGTMRWPATATGNIAGAVFISRTRADDRTAANPLGSVLSTPGPVVADFTGSGVVSFDMPEIDRANQAFPFVVIASREQL